MNVLPPILLLLLALLYGRESTAATYQVTKTADTNDGVCNADCSLREAIQASTTVSGSINDVIMLPAGLYRLTIPRGARIDNAPGTGADGNLVVDTLLTIVGAGRDTTLIDARPTAGGLGVDRVLSLTLNGRLTLSGVTLRGGRTLGQGGGILSLRGQLELTDAAIRESSATGGGGGLGASSGATTTIRRSLIADNTSGNTSGPIGSGGGIQNIQSTLTIVDSTISGNTALLSTGGGIMNIDNQPRPNPPAILDIRRSTIVDNLAGDPAGVSIFEGVGGGLYNSSGRVWMENSTVTRNEAVPSFAVGFGALPGTGRGGGVAHKMLLGDDPADGTTIVNSTLAYNTALTGWQLYGFITFKTAIVANTIVAHSPGATPNSNCASEPGAFGMASYGGNLSSDASPCNFNTGFDRPPSTPPGLAAGPGNNGGPTQTIALLPGSAAVGGGSVLFCPDTDQRGHTRAFACDIGAVELLPEPGPGATTAAGVALIAWLRRRRTSTARADSARPIGPDAPERVATRLNFSRNVWMAVERWSPRLRDASGLAMRRTFIRGGAIELRVFTWFLTTLSVILAADSAGATVVIHHTAMSATNGVAIDDLITVGVRLSWDGQGALQGVHSSTTFDSSMLEYVSNTTAPASILGFTDSSDPENPTFIPGLSRLNTSIRQPGDPAAILRTVQYAAIAPVDPRAATAYGGGLIMALTFRVIAFGTTRIETLIANGDIGAVGDTFQAGGFVVVNFIPEPGTALLLGLGLAGLGSHRRPRGPRP